MTMNKSSLRSKEGKKMKCVDCKLFGNLNKDDRCSQCEKEAMDALCEECRQTVKEVDNGLGCEVCMKCYHAGCASVSVAMYKALKSDKALSSMALREMQEPCKIKQGRGKTAKT